MGWILKIKNLVRVLLVVAVATVVTDIIAFWNSIVALADTHEGLAAWVQALGVFFAVLLSGYLANRQSRMQEKKRVQNNLLSVTAVVGRALQAVCDIESAVFLKSYDREIRDSVLMMDTIFETLTPLRIHELPSGPLIGLALEIRAEVRELSCWLLDNTMVLAMERAELVMPPDALKRKVERAKADCECFLRYASRSTS